MKILYTEDEFLQAKTKDKLKLSCEQCSSTFLATKGHVKEALSKVGGRTCQFCSKECQFKAQITQEQLQCALCSTVL